MNQIVPLNLVEKNEMFEIKKFLLNAKDAEHLRDLGAVEGKKAVVVENQKSSIVVKINDTRYALNKDFASKILVNVLAKENEFNI